MQNIYYWRDVYGDQNLFTPYREWILRLWSGERSGLHFEKLRTSGGWPIYSIRVSESDRLLFTTYKHSLCLLDVVLNHDYAKSRFFRNPERIRNFIEQMQGSRFDLGFEYEWEATEEVEIGVAEREPSYQALDYYQKSFISLSPVQEDVLHVSLPLIVSGPAGSGKTCTAISVLGQYILTHPGEQVLYLSRSSGLVRQMQTLWAETNPGCMQVDFKTYADLYAGVDDAAIFSEWYSSLGVGATAVTMLAADKMWQEFRIRSGFADDAPYLSLGARETHIDMAGRNDVCLFYKRFMAYLSGAMALNLSYFNQDLPYQLTVVDEAQDLSFAQLRSLYRGTGGKLIFLLGSHQILFDSISRVNYLKGLLHASGDIPKVVVLPVSYRAGEKLVDVANGLIRLKSLVTGGLTDKYEPSRMAFGLELAGKGQFECWSTKDERIASLSSSGQMAVITLAAYKDEARRIFATPLVFTTEEVKGLEFHTVVLWKLLTDGVAREVSKVLRDKSDADVGTHRAKPGQGDSQYLSVCDAWITAVTRAQQRVIWVDDERHEIKPIYELLQGLVTRGVVDESPAVDWSQELKRLQANDLHEQAKNVYIERMGGSLEGFMGFKESCGAGSNLKSPPEVAELPNYDAAYLSLESYLVSDNKKKRMSFPAELKRLLADEGKAEVKKTWLYALLNRETGALQLQQLLQKQKNLFEEIIPRGIWFKPLDESGRTLLNLLGQQGELGYDLMLDLLSGLKSSEKKKLLIPALDLLNEHAIVFLLNANVKGRDLLVKLYSKKSLQNLSQLTVWPSDMCEHFLKIVEQASLKRTGELAKSLQSLNLNFDINAARYFKEIALRAINKNDEWMLGLISKWNMAHYLIFGESEKLSLLHKVVIKNDLKILKLLLRPENIDCETSEMRTLLFLAACDGNMYLVKYLCINRANLNKVSNLGTSPVYIAAKLGHVPVVRYLTLLGADINIARPDGLTPLIAAVQNGYYEVVEFLCKNGANFSKKTNDGKTALDIAKEYGFVQIVELLTWHEATIQDMTRLHIAVLRGDLRDLKYLVEKGANINHVLDHGYTFLCVAAEKGNLMIVEYLCEKGADIYKKTNKGQTALDIAIERGHVEVVEFLGYFQKRKRLETSALGLFGAGAPAGGSEDRFNLQPF